MFDIGWPELLVIGTILIVVVGPKDLPPMLRAFGKTVSKVRGMAAEFRGQFDEALREAELDEVRKTVDDVRGLNPKSAMEKAMSPFKAAGEDVRRALDEAGDDDFEPFDTPVMEPLDASQEAQATSDEKATAAGKSPPEKKSEPSSSSPKTSTKSGTGGPRGTETGKAPATKPKAASKRASTSAQAKSGERKARTVKPRRAASAKGEASAATKSSAPRTSSRKASAKNVPASNEASS